MASLLTLSSIVSILLITSHGPTVYILTPNGNYAEGWNNSNITEVDQSAYDAYMASNWSLARRFGSATNKYNCHSYSFYKQKESLRKYVIPGTYNFVYLQSGNYSEVSFSNVVAGDRIVYFAGTADYEAPAHSGIISKKVSGSSNFTGYLYGADKVVVDSKWGDYGLYKHWGNYYAYMPAYDNSSETIQRIRYYHLDYSHTHSFTYSEVTNDETYHFKECSCGCYFEEHSYVPYNLNSIMSIDYIPAYRCTKCHYISYYGVLDPV